MCTVFVFWLILIFNPADLDECSLSNSSCHQNANCTNTNGSFECNCLPGYTGDGFNCSGERHQYIFRFTADSVWFSH